METVQIKHLCIKVFQITMNSIGHLYYIKRLEQKKKKEEERIYPIKTRKELLNLAVHTRKINCLK